ncbi:caldesmon-like [Helianthus annuus]|uniref:caldesmon-like n=1 Tax=Helianthus annuus TaxID=4232 RepID=UPI000B8F0902|nr:caldesmon-like [Helianthus annuus]
MEGFLKDYGFWDVIEPTADVVVDERKMYTALGYICQTLPEDILVQVGILMNAKEVWRALKIRFLGIDHVRKEEQEKAAQEAAEKERLDEIAEKERLDAIVQEEQARKKEAQEATEKEEALQTVLVCFPNSNNLEDEETVKISLQQRSKKPATDHDDDERKDLVPYEVKGAINKSAHLEPYVKVNNRASVEEKSELNEKFKGIVKKKSPTWFNKERKTNQPASFGSKSNDQECLDKQRKKRSVGKKNLSIEQVMQQIFEDRKVQEKKVKNEFAFEINVDGLNDEREEPVKQVCYKQMKRKNKDGPMIGIKELRMLLGIQDLGGTKSRKFESSFWIKEEC